MCFGFHPFTFGHVCDAVGRQNDADSRFPSGMETYDVHENQIPSGARQRRCDLYKVYSTVDAICTRSDKVLVQ